MATNIYTGKPNEIRVANLKLGDHGSAFGGAKRHTVDWPKTETDNIAVSEDGREIANTRARGALPVAFSAREIEGTFSKRNRFFFEVEFSFPDVGAPDGADGGSSAASDVLPIPALAIGLRGCRHTKECYAVTQTQGTVSWNGTHVSLDTRSVIGPRHLNHAYGERLFKHGDVVGVFWEIDPSGNCDANLEFVLNGESQGPMVLACGLNTCAGPLMKENEVGGIEVHAPFLSYSPSVRLPSGFSVKSVAVTDEKQVLTKAARPGFK